MNCLLSLMILLCLAQGFLPIFFPYVKKTVSRLIFELSSFVINIDSIIDVYAQYESSPVIHNVESWGGPHDLLHVFNTFLVIDDFTPSISSEHDHRAVAAAFVHRQNCAFCVSDLKIDVHGGTGSVGERNITLMP